MGGFFDFVIRQSERAYERNYDYIKQTFNLAELAANKPMRVSKAADVKSLNRFDPAEVHNQ
jgi:hypothetical protein